MNGTNEFIQEDLDFLADLNDPNKGTPVRETLKADYLRNLDEPVKRQLENITRRVFDPNFLLCYSCNHEVFAMVKRVMEKYDAEQGQEGQADTGAADVVEGQATPKGRGKKA